MTVWVTYNFLFNDGVDMEEVAGTLALSAIGAAGLHGSTALTLECPPELDRKRRVCSIIARGQPAHDLAKLFHVFLAKEFGPSSFRVERSDFVAQK